MRKILSVLLVLSMLLTASAALAEGMGVQVIGGPETETEPVSLDDLKLNVEAEIPGYGTVTATSFEYVDGLGHYDPGYSKYRYGDERDYYWSGAEADYAILHVDILNIAKSGKDFLANCSVKVVFDDEYEYGGWAYQQNFDNDASTGWSSNEWLDADKKKLNERWVINVADQFAIDPMYQGHFVFGCTLPNAVVNSKAPLKMIITIDGNEITYNIRK